MPRRYSMARRGEATEETRGRMQTAFSRLLASKAYGAITMADIASEADVSVRTVQRHYRTKDELLAALCGRSVQWISQGVSERARRRSPREEIQLLVDLHFRYYAEHDAECWALYSRAPEVPEIQQALAIAAQAWMEPFEEVAARWPHVWAVDRESVQRVVLALTSYPVWRGFTGLARFSTAEAAELVTKLLSQELLADR